jgi:hypothetical protein
MNRKRYSELEEVSIDVKKLPPSLQPLIEDFRKWCFYTDDAVEANTVKASISELQGLVDRCEPHLDAVEKYAYAHANDTVMPHEAALVQIFINNYLNARGELALRLRKEKPRRGKS